MSIVNQEMLEQYLSNQLEGRALRDFKLQLETDTNLREALEERQRFQRYEDFIKGAMSVQEANAFEQNLKDDSSLRLEFQNFKTAFTILEQDAKLQIREFISEVERKNPISTQRRILPWRALSIAASVLLVVGFGFLYFLSNSQLDGKTIAEASFKPYPVKGVLMGAHPIGEPTISSLAQQAYKDRSYDQAAKLFSSITKKDPLYGSAQFYYGNALMAQQEYKQAIDALENSLQYVEEDKGKGKWFLALALLADEQKERATSILDDLEKNAADSFYREQAIKLLKELNANE